MTTKVIVPNSIPVLICTSCGRGFLVMPRGSVDIDPVWRVVSTGQEGGVCGGEIRAVDRIFANQVADNYQEDPEWLHGKRN